MDTPIRTKLVQVLLTEAQKRLDATATDPLEWAVVETLLKQAASVCDIPSPYESERHPFFEIFDRVYGKPSDE